MSDKKNKKPQPNQDDFLTDASVDAAEIAHFTTMAKEWWDKDGKFKPLHKLNPTRLDYITANICHAFDKTMKGKAPFKGLRVLDIGCGGGLLCEPLAELGATVIGADATKANIEVASLHARTSGLTIDYRNTTAEALAAAGEKFDIIINMEVLEHVADIQSFLSACKAIIKKDGIMLFSTLNRTPQSYLAAIVGAEYILRWLPVGTHHWKKFLKPSEINRAMEATGFSVKEFKGMSYNPLKDKWRLSNDLSINYLGKAV
jgi:2-polyprenyl-6-hydroxyphenyl methylase/3-demethylubiquinone-9 3-methyltransferase